MKRSLLVLACLLLFTCGSFAAGAGIGMRSIGMGGTGIATANDVTAGYFNPAGLMFGPENFEMQVSAGGATQGLTDIMEAASQGDKFTTDNFDKDLRFAGNLSAGLGLSARKVGLGLYAKGEASFNKPADALTYDINTYVLASTPLTLGTSFSTPGLPIASLAVGANVKAFTEFGYFTNVTQTSPTTGTGSTSNLSGSGYGIDLGAQTKITPLISVGVVIRNISASISRTIKSTSITVTSSETTDGAEVDTKSTYTPAPEVGIGVGVVIPITGTLIACDLENYSFPEDFNLNKSTTYNDLHIGIEQGFLFNTVMLRLGYYNDGPAEDSFYTYGLGLNFGPASLGIAAANSQKDFNNSMGMAQIGVAF